ncbi:MAG: GIY-YIG nuclease family protein [Chloroflexota bacterium]
MFYVYILKCSDGSYYTGMAENLEYRLAQHQAGTFEDGYTASRRPVEMMWSAQFASHDDAFRRERQIKGWSRAKKEALIRGDWDGIRKVIQQEHERREAKKDQPGS